MTLRQHLLGTLIGWTELAVTFGLFVLVVVLIERRARRYDQMLKQANEEK